MKTDVMQVYDPINVLKPVAENIWIVDGPVIGMAIYGTELPFTTRMTVVRLADNSLWVHSPVAWTETLAKQLEGLGPIRHLVSPNKIHYAYLGDWQKRYPDATTWASPGVRERAASQNIVVNFDADLSEQAPPQWAEEIDQMIFHGSRFMDEVVFFHRRTATLILTDLIENFELDKVAKKYGWLLKLSGCADPDGKLPIDLRTTFWGHKSTARDCYHRMIAWQPEKIIIAHGRWYPENAMAELSRAFRWLN